MVNKRLIQANYAVARSELLSRLRASLSSLEFIEIHTPAVVRGARETSIFHQGDAPFSLRHSMELLLRSAMASGLEKVYEIGPAFRFGDADRLRHPEFYMLELFQAHLNYAGLVSLTEILLKAAFGAAPAMKRVSVTDWLLNDLGVDCACDEIELKRKILERMPELKQLKDVRNFVLVNRIVESRLEPSLREWTLLEDFPACTICLADRQSGKPHLIQRFEVFSEHVEIAHGFIDAMDAADVRSRMEQSGPFFTDHEFLSLLENKSLPPSGGVGFGIERLLLTAHPGSQVLDFIHLSQHACA